MLQPPGVTVTSTTVVSRKGAVETGKHVSCITGRIP